MVEEVGSIPTDAQSVVLQITALACEIMSPTQRAAFKERLEAMAEQIAQPHGQSRS